MFGYPYRTLVPSSGLNLDLKLWCVATKDDPVAPFRRMRHFRWGRLFPVDDQQLVIRVPIEFTVSRTSGFTENRL